MNELSDNELLRRYAATGEEAPFTELVRRHLNLVWGAARRTTGDGDAARDVAQLVFVDLARKARHLGSGTVLEGWLYRAACHAAAKHVRTETRRTQRERLAMQDPSLNPSVLDDARAAEVLQPELDAALAQLAEGDRDALILRFLAGHSLAEVGRRLGTTEDTAQKPVSRALDRVRVNLEKRGISAAGGTLAAALTVAGAQAAPAGMSAGISASALAGAAAGGWGMITASTVMKSKLVVGLVGTGAVVVALAFQRQQMRRLDLEATALRNQVAVLRAEGSSRRLDTNSEPTPELIRLREEHAELLRLRGEMARLREVKRARSSEYLGAAKSAQVQIATSETQMLEVENARQQSAILVQALKRVGIAARMFEAEHKGRLPKTFEEIHKELDLDQQGNIMAGVSVRQFEFVPRSGDLDPTALNEIYLRERNPRLLPDGTWERVYGWPDGSAEVVTNSTSDFSAFERTQTGPRNIPK